MKEIRLAVGTYHSINTWQQAERSLNAEGFTRFTAQNPELAKFMTELWEAQFAAQEESQ